MIFRANKKRSPLTDQESQVVGMLLQGDTEFLEGLRRQLLPPFHMWVERRTPKSKHVYRTPANEFHLELVFDGNRRSEYSVDDSISLNVDDMFIRDNRIGSSLQVSGVVSRGVLVRVVFRANGPTRWPKSLRMDDWWFVEGDDNQKVRSREVLSRLDLPIRRTCVADLPDGWFRSFLTNSTDAGRGVGLRAPIGKTEIGSLEAEIGCSIPGEFRSFLEATNGANFWGVIVFGSDELYPLDKEVFARDLLAISCAEDGSVSALSSDGGVYFFDHISGETSLIASSFGEWLKKLDERSPEEE